MAIKTPDWVQDAVFYQIFPDRFAISRRLDKQGLNLEPWDTSPTPYGFKGGDLLGIVEHLDYLEDLGVNALYLNPITASASNHRYHTYDYMNIDPLLGGNSAFRELIDTAHERGFKIVIDGVFNHASRGFWPFHHVLENGAGSPYVDWFHFNPDRLGRTKHWGAYPTQEEEHLISTGVGTYNAIGYQAWWNLPALPKFNTTHPAVREYIFNAAVHWINLGIDGWRLDVPADIDDDSFWQEFRKRVKSANPEAYIVGEIWHEAKRWLRGDQFDAVMNYLLTGAIMGWLIGERLPPYIFNIGDYHKYLRPMNAHEFADRIDSLLGLYAQEINGVQFNLLDSHDTPRFITTAGHDVTSLKLGWLFLMTYVGAPCIYYGDEIGMSGGSDPDCRGAFNWDRKDWDLEVFGYAKSLIRLRKTHSALRRGSFERLYADKDVYAFARLDENEIVIVIINAGTGRRIVSIPTPPGLPAGLLTNLLDDGPSPAIEGGYLREVMVYPRCGLVLGTILNEHR